MREAIFEKFVQADTSITRQYGGSGLGLSISQKIARMMEGSITLKTEEGKGSVFTLSIPHLKAAGINP
jgi:signal transduction histidine kinase